MFRTKTSIAFMVVVALVIATTLVLGALGVINYSSAKERELENVRMTLVLDANQIAPSLDLPVWNFDRSEIAKVVEGMMLDPILKALVVRSADNQTIICARERDVQGNIKPLETDFPAAGFLVEKRNITVANETLAMVTLFGTTKSVTVKMHRILAWTIFNIVALDLILILSLYLLLWRFVLRPLKTLEQHAAAVSTGSRESMTLRGPRFRGELENLRTSLAKMFRLLEERYQEVQESESRFRTLTDAAFEGIFISENGWILDVNEQGLKMFGYDRKEMIGKEIVELVVPEWRDSIAERIRAGQETIYGHQLLRKDGSTFFAEAQAKMVCVGGRTLRMTALRDVTDRKHAEELTNTQIKVMEMIAANKPMRETLDKLICIIESQSPEMLCSVLLLDPDGLHVCHGAAPSLPADYLKAIDGLAIGERTGSCGTAAFRREPVFVADIENDPLWTDFKHLALPYGLRACWSTPIFDAQRRVLGTFAIYYRQTGLPDTRHLRLIEMATHTAAVSIAKNRTDEALRESEEKFSKAFQASPDGICITELETGRFMEVNEGYCKLFHYPREQLIGCSAEELRIFENLDTRKRFVNALLAQGSIRDMELTTRRRDGQTMLIQASAERIELGTKRCIVTVIHDITDHKRAETQRVEAIRREQRARVEYTFQLIASQEAERTRIARELHDSLGQNLSIIKNRAHQARQAGSLPPAAANHLEAIERIVAEAITETRNMAHNLRPLHIEQSGLTDSLRELIREVSQSSQIRFERRLENVDDVFKGEAATNVYRIMQEALNNLIKHSRATQAMVTLERDVHSVRLNISDDGVGFDMSEKIAKSGLGLTGLGERARMLGGTFNIESAPKQGTHLTMELPIVDSESVS